MARTVGTFILSRLHQWGVKRIYGYPGDGLDGDVHGILGGFHHAPGVRLIQVRHEEMAAFMACAHAKFTGEVGVCLATSGPGAIRLLNGLYDAHADHQPVVAIVGQTDRGAMGGDEPQEIDLHTLFKDVAHEYVQTAMTPTQIRQLVDRAVRIAIAERAVTCIIVPRDLQEMDAASEPKHAHGAVHAGVGYERPRVLPTEESLTRAAAVLNEGAKVAILVGQGALGATAEVAEMADRLGAGVAKALLGKCVLPDDLPWVTGAIGLLGTKPSWDLMSECDTLFMIGSSFPYSEFLPQEGQARGVQIDLAARRISLRYPMEVNLVGDARETLHALLPKIARKHDRSFRKRVEQNVVEWWKVLEARAMAPANPVNPQRVFWELSPRLPDAAIITADSGTAANWFARDVRVRPGMMASLSGGLATMGAAVPYAIAAKFAHPCRAAIALVGDGAMQMDGLDELITIAKYWREWSDPRLVVLVLTNRDLNVVAYAGFAESIGLRGVRVSEPDQIARAWDAAFAADRPVVIEAVTDPDVSPLPPHISPAQARAFSRGRKA